MSRHRKGAAWSMQTATEVAKNHASVDPVSMPRIAGGKTEVKTSLKPKTRRSFY